MLALLLGAVAVIGLHRHSIVWFWTGVAIASLALSFGDYLPFGLNHLLHRTPVYNLFRASFRHMFEFTFACAVLAGLGVNYIGQWNKKPSNRALSVTLPGRRNEKALENAEHAEITEIEEEDRVIRTLCVGTAILATVVLFTLLLYVFGGRHSPPNATGPAASGSTSNPEVFIPLFFFVISVAALWYYASRRTRFSCALLIFILLADLVSYGHFLEWRSYTFSVAEGVADPSSVKYIKSREPDLNSFRILSHAAQPFGANIETQSGSPSGNGAEWSNGDQSGHSLGNEQFRAYSQRRASGASQIAQERWSNSGTRAAHRA